MKLFGALILPIFLIGCFEKNEPILSEKEVKTVSWYLENPEQRKSILIECQENPGVLDESPNCVNAKEAELKASKKGTTTRF